jgi:hypothetical protein
MEFHFDNVEVLHGGNHLKLVKITKSKHKEKKWDAYFSVDGEREKVVSFGATGYQDYTQHKNDFRKKLYLERHGRGREHWSKPDSPGALSRWVLWNKPGFRESVADFKRRFHLG